jgi:hypothetical protein
MELIKLIALLCSIEGSNANGTLQEKLKCEKKLISCIAMQDMFFAGSLNTEKDIFVGFANCFKNLEL